MNKIVKTLRLSKKEYYITHLMLINPILPIKLSKKEAEVLAHFMMLEGDLKIMPFCYTGRQKIKDELSLSNGGLSNYMRAFREGNFVYEDKNKIEKILPILYPDSAHQEYNFRIIHE